MRFPRLFELIQEHIARRKSRNRRATGHRIPWSNTAAAESLETLEQVVAAGGSGQVESLDVTSEDAWRQLIDRLRTEWPQLDLLVNNAGVCCAGEVGALPLADWRWICEVNLMGAVYGCRSGHIDQWHYGPAGPTPRQACPAPNQILTP